MRWRRRPDGPDRSALTDAPTTADPAGGTAASGDTATERADDAWARRRPAPAVEVPARLGQVDESDLARARRRTVARALAEDLGDAGDVTTAACVPPTLDGTGDVVARADGVVAGTAALVEVFGQVDPRVEVEVQIGDGDRVAVGDVVATARGRLRSILTAERVALNLLCHLSGIATQTRRYADAVAGTGAVVRDTRKTTPGLRLLEKDAVRAGGGANHRVGLHDALLVKDNHVLAAGSAAMAARRALDRAGGRHVQVEVSSVDQLDEVLKAGVTDILLDNFHPDQIRIAVRRVDGRARLEASGNVTLDNVRDYAEAGADRIAIGALTHSAPWLDLALDVRGEDLDVPVLPPVEDVPVEPGDPPTWESVAAQTVTAADDTAAGSDDDGRG